MPKVTTKFADFRQGGPVAHRAIRKEEHDVSLDP